MKVVEIYIKNLTNKNYSQRTIETYSCYLEKFLKEISKNPYHITTKEIEGYLLNKEYSSISQQNQIIGSLKLFAEYILRKKQIHLSKIKRPRKEKKLPIVIDAELLASKIRSIDNLKHRAILTLGLSCGLRVSEVINLKWSHLDKKRNTLTAESWSWSANKHFTKIRIYYLRKTGGGSFRYGFSNILTGSRPTQSMDGVLSIQYVEVARAISDSVTIVVDQIDGNVAFFGVWLFNGDDGVSVLNLGKGGMTLTKQMQLDSSFRQAWFGILQPAVYLLNTGTNDRITVTGTDFETMLTTYCNNVIAGSPTTNLIIVNPNQPSDYATTYAADYTEKRKAVATSLGLDYLDIPEIIGDYTYFSIKSLMADGVHPNAAGFKLIAKAYLEFLQIQNYGNYSEVPNDLFSGGSLSVYSIIFVS